MTDREQLLEAARTAAKVEIVVTDCVYACCGGRWRRRAGYEQTYRGRIVRLEPDDRFELHAIAVSSLNYAVCSELEHLLDLVVVD